MSKPANTTTREARAGQGVYVKRYGEDEQRTAAEARERTSREAHLLRSLSAIGTKGPRFGILRLIDVDSENAQITTAEIAGEPLEASIHGSPRDASFRLRRAFFLAGRWLRHFHELPVPEAESVFREEPFVAYIRERVDRLVRQGWASANFAKQILPAFQTLLANADDRRRRLSWCHGDYAAFNVFWDGGTLTPIDFEMCNIDVPLTDVAYFVHRLEMLAVEKPWRSWRIDLWRRAFLRGYGNEALSATPMYQACMIRHCVCRLLTLGRQTRTGLKGGHDRYVSWVVRRRLRRLTEVGRRQRERSNDNQRNPGSGGRRSATP